MPIWRGWKETYSPNECGKNRSQGNHKRNDRQEAVSKFP